jgi:large subunit ribosomal protein L30
MTDKSVKVTLIKSLAGQLANIRASARGLGLRRIGHSVVVSDTPANRGMMNTASHMLTVEPGSAAAPKKRAPGKTDPEKKDPEKKD